jgi:predicted TIM-barrel fold metal-dependent hydrolase
MPNVTTRRRFLQSAAVASVFASTRMTSSAAAQDKAIPRVDSHLHCFAGAKDTRFPYHERGPYKPEPAATPEHLLACMKDAGVDYALVVHPEPYQDDHRYLEHCLDVGKEKLKGTLLLFADREGSLEKMPELCRKLNPVSVRVHAYSPDRLPPFGKPELRKLWSMATDHGLAVQLHFEPRYAPGFEPLIREFSKTTVIIDHMGRPFQGTPAEHAVVLGWAKHNNTIMKLSSLAAATTYPHREITPVIKQLIDAWGADRMIFGDSFGAETTGASYRQAFDRARGLLAHLSTPDQDKILGGTAAKLFRFGD